MSLCDKVQQYLIKTEEKLAHHKCGSADYYLDSAQNLVDGLKSGLFFRILYAKCIHSLQDRIFYFRADVAAQSAVEDLRKAEESMNENNYKTASNTLSKIEEYHAKAGVFPPKEFYEAGKKIFDALCPFYLNEISSALKQRKHESAEHLVSLLERAARHADKALPDEVLKIKKELSEIPKEKYNLI